MTSEKKPDLNESDMSTNPDHNWMDLAYHFSMYSGCMKYKVGAIIVQNNEAVGVGHNREIPNGPQMCCETHADISLITDMHGVNDSTVIRERDHHREWSRKNEVHAEIVAIKSALSRISLSELANTTMYCTLAPCYECSKFISEFGLKRVVYCESRDKELDWSDILLYNNIIVDKVECTHVI